MLAIVYDGRRYTGSSGSLVAQLERDGCPNAARFVHDQAIPAPTPGLRQLYEGAVGILKSAIRPIQPDEVRRRADICRECSWRVQSTGSCMACETSQALSTVANAAIDMFYRRDTVHVGDLSNYGCGHCGCALEPLLRSSLDDISDRSTRPPKCWATLK